MAKRRTDYSVRATLEARDQISGRLGRIGRRLRRNIGAPLARIGRQAKAAAVGLAKLGAVGAAAGGAAAAGIFKLAEGHAKVADDLAKSAKRAGVSGQWIAEMGHAAQLSGASLEEFRRGAEKAARTVGELRAGTGPLVTLLTKTSPAFLEQLKATESTAEAMDLLIAGMAAIPDQGRRAAFAAAAFGRAGQKMTLMVDGGVEGLEAMREEFRRLHGPVTDAGLAAGEGFVDAVRQAKTAVGGLKWSIGAALLPVLQPLVDRFTEWAAANRGLVAERVAEWVGDVVDSVRSIDWAAWGQRIETVADALRGIAEAARMALDSARAFGRWVEQHADSLDVFGIAAPVSGTFSSEQYRSLGVTGGAGSSGISGTFSGSEYEALRGQGPGRGPAIDPAAFRGLSPEQGMARLREMRGGGARPEAVVRVELSGAPAGTRVREVRSSGGLDVRPAILDVGRRPSSQGVR